MQVGILGPLRVTADQREVPIGGAQLRALLIRLALEPGTVLTVDTLAGALWPDGGPSEPANAVQTLVSRLRRALPDRTVVSSRDGGYQLDLPPDAVDAARFELLVADGRRALHCGEHRTAAKRLAEALALWRGEALADVAGARYAVTAAARLDEERLSALADRIAAELTFTPPGSVVAELRERVAAHPLRERFRTLLITALHADSRRVEALAVYEQYRHLLADEFGTDPGEQAHRAYLAVLRDEPPRHLDAAAGGLVGPAEPPAPPTRPRGNLRAALTSFVGRVQERHQVRARLGEHRLVTLVGPGGSGKTRLAATVAADLGGEYPGGSWLVELATLREPGEVAQAVVDTLGLRQHQGPPGELTGPPPDPVDQLVDALSATATLLVLDNCEHLLDAAAALADRLLGRCPSLRVLATSREPLGVLGEALVPVPPLPLPAPDDEPDRAAGYPAVRLFADRARAARAGFAVTAANAGTVVEICRRLDGLPLAIELAAARLRSLSLDQVADRIDDRFRLLTTGSRTALPRHQTLQAVVSWSWDLLTGAERRAAERLSVVPAVITPEGARHLLGPAATDLVPALVDKSLLQLHDDGQPRYRMLETIREYAAGRLRDAGGLDDARAAYTRYVLDLAERAVPSLRSAEQVPWLARLAAEQGGLAALAYARERGDAATAVRLAAALGAAWTIQGHHDAAARRLRQALLAPGPVPSAARAAAAASYLLNAMLAGGDFDGRLLDQLRTTVGAGLPARPGGDPSVAMVRAMLAFLDHDTTAGMAVTGAHLGDPDPWVRGVMWLLRTWLHANEAATAQMERGFTAAAAAFRQCGDRWGLATTLTHHAYVLTVRGEFDRAIAGLQEAVDLLRQLDPADPAVQQRVQLAATRGQRGDRERARTELQQVIRGAGGAASGRYLALARLSLGDLARLDGDLAGAARQYDAADEHLLLAAFDPSAFRAMLLCARGHLALAGGDLATARAHLAEALARSLDPPDVMITADVAVAVASLCHQDGDRGTAAEVLGAAHALRGSPDERDPDVVAVTARLRRALGERTFRAAYGRGRGRDRDGALARIRSSLADRTPGGPADQARRR